MLDHLDHTAKVHKAYYKNCTGFVEKVHVGKILFMQDLGIQHKYLKTPLDDIHFPELIKETPNTSVHSRRSRNSNKSSNKKKLGGSQSEESEQSESMDSDSKPKRRKSRVKRRKPANKSGQKRKLDDSQSEESESMDSDRHKSQVKRRKAANKSGNKRKLDVGSGQSESMDSAQVGKVAKQCPRKKRKGEDESDYCDERRIKKKGKSNSNGRQYNTWSREERHELKKVFADNIKKLSPPSAEDCRIVSIKSAKDGGILHKRGARLIAKKMSADIAKLVLKAKEKVSV